MTLRVAGRLVVKRAGRTEDWNAVLVAMARETAAAKEDERRGRESRRMEWLLFVLKRLRWIQMGRDMEGRDNNWLEIAAASAAAAAGVGRGAVAGRKGRGGAAVVATAAAAAAAGGGRVNARREWGPKGRKAVGLAAGETGGGGSSSGKVKDQGFEGCSETVDGDGDGDGGCIGEEVLGKGLGVGVGDVPVLTVGGADSREVFKGAVVSVAARGAGARGAAGAARGRRKGLKWGSGVEGRRLSGAGWSSGGEGHAGRGGAHESEKERESEGVGTGKGWHGMEAGEGDRNKGECAVNGSVVVECWREDEAMDTCEGNGLTRLPGYEGVEMVVDRGGMVSQDEQASVCDEMRGGDREGMSMREGMRVERRGEMRGGMIMREGDVEESAHGVAEGGEGVLFSDGAFLLREGVEVGVEVEEGEEEDKDGVGEGEEGDEEEEDREGEVVCHELRMSVEMEEQARVALEGGESVLLVDDVSGRAYQLLPAVVVEGVGVDGGREEAEGSDEEEEEEEDGNEGECECEEELEEEEEGKEGEHEAMVVEEVEWEEDGGEDDKEKEEVREEEREGAQEGEEEKRRMEEERRGMEEGEWERRRQEEATGGEEAWAAESGVAGGSDRGNDGAGGLAEAGGPYVARSLSSLSGDLSFCGSLEDAGTIGDTSVGTERGSCSVYSRGAGGGDRARGGSERRAGGQQNTGGVQGVRRGGERLRGGRGGGEEVGVGNQRARLRPGGGVRSGGEGVVGGGMDVGARAGAAVGRVGGGGRASTGAGPGEGAGVVARAAGEADAGRLEGEGAVAGGDTSQRGEGGGSVGVGSGRGGGGRGMRGGGAARRGRGRGGARESVQLETQEERREELQEEEQEEEQEEDQEQGEGEYREGELMTEQPSSDRLSTVQPGTHLSGVAHSMESEGRRASSVRQPRRWWLLTGSSAYLCVACPVVLRPSQQHPRQQLPEQQEVGPGQQHLVPAGRQGRQRGSGGDRRGGVAVVGARSEGVQSGDSDLEANEREMRGEVMEGEEEEDLPAGPEGTVSVSVEEVAAEERRGAFRAVEENEANSGSAAFLRHATSGGSERNEESTEVVADRESERLGDGGEGVRPAVGAAAGDSVAEPSEGAGVAGAREEVVSCGAVNSAVIGICSPADPGALGEGSEEGEEVGEPIGSENVLEEAGCLQEDGSLNEQGARDDDDARNEEGSEEVEDRGVSDRLLVGLAVAVGAAAGSSRGATCEVQQQAVGVAEPAEGIDIAGGVPSGCGAAERGAHAVVASFVPAAIAHSEVDVGGTQPPCAAAWTGETPRSAPDAAPDAAPGTRQVQTPGEAPEAGSSQTASTAATGPYANPPANATLASQQPLSTPLFAAENNAAATMYPAFVAPPPIAPHSIAPPYTAPRTTAPPSIAPYTIAPPTIAPHTIAPSPVAPPPIAPSPVAPPPIAPHPIAPAPCPSTLSMPSPSSIGEAAAAGTAAVTAAGAFHSFVLSNAYAPQPQGYQVTVLPPAPSMGTPPQVLPYTHDTQQTSQQALQPALQQTIVQHSIGIQLLPSMGQEPLHSTPSNPFQPSLAPVPHAPTNPFDPSHPSNLPGSDPTAVPMLAVSYAASAGFSLSTPPVPSALPAVFAPPPPVPWHQTYQQHDHGGVVEEGREGVEERVGTEVGSAGAEAARVTAPGRLSPARFRRVVSSGAAQMTTVNTALPVPTGARMGSPLTRRGIDGHTGAGVLHSSNSFSGGGGGESSSAAAVGEGVSGVAGSSNRGEVVLRMHEQRQQQRQRLLLLRLQRMLLTRGESPINEDGEAGEGEENQQQSLTHQQQHQLYEQLQQSRGGGRDEQALVDAAIEQALFGSSSSTQLTSSAAAAAVAASAAPGSSGIESSRPAVSMRLPASARVVAAMAAAGTNAGAGSGIGIGTAGTVAGAVGGNVARSTSGTVAGSVAGAGVPLVAVLGGPPIQVSSRRTQSPALTHTHAWGAGVSSSRRQVGVERQRGGAEEQEEEGRRVRAVFTLSTIQ
ncbi:unnamed protein product [Closterium sp. Naga37s-1]|nr:unnamed protein product [Closterium sp. Naga37s-1]